MSVKIGPLGCKQRLAIRKELFVGVLSMVDWESDNVNLCQCCTLIIS